jgi:predicted membrane protein
MPAMPFAAILSLIIVGSALWLVNGYIPLTQRAKPIINVVLGLIVVGILLWLVNTYVPMAESIKAILNILVVIAVCVGALQALGLWDPLVKMWNNLRTRMLTRAEHPPRQPQFTSGTRTPAP